MRNNKIARIFLAAGIVAGLSITASAKGGPKPSSGCASGSNVNVTTLIADTDSNSLPFQFQSDGKGPYTTYTNSKTDSVVSEIQGNSCDWLFDTSTSASRTVGLTLLYQASTPSAPPPFTNATQVGSRVISKCSLNPNNNGISYGTMTFTEQTLQCELSIGQITYNGKTYGLRFEPNNYAGATWVQVTCTGAVSSQCNAWTVTPIPNTAVNPSTGQATAIGELVQLSTVKGQTVATPLGLYYVAFSVTVHE
jgi:hypothetical protein